MIEFLQNRDWDILLADKILCQPDWDWSTDTARIDGYHFWYLISGEATVRTLNSSIKLLPGDIYLFNLDQSHYCTHDPKNPLHVYTCFFKENDVIKHKAYKKVRSTKLVCENPIFTGKLFSNLVRDYNNNNKEDCMVWLNAIMSEQLSQLDSENTNPISKVIDRINTNPTHQYTLDELSGLCGYSKNHFLRLFKAKMHISPMEYCIRSRLSLAKHYLLYSNYSINAISTLCGYSDISHFSKQFKKFEGISPNRYRNVK